MTDRRTWIGIIICFVVVAINIIFTFWSPFPTKKQRAAEEAFRLENPVAARIKGWEDVSDDSAIIEAVFEEYTLKEMIEKIGWDYWEYIDLEGLQVRES